MSELSFGLGPLEIIPCLQSSMGSKMGGKPRGHLLANPDGSFYGTTYDPSTVFRVRSDGALTTIFESARATLPNRSDKSV